ncbi:MAG TPA: hypothetical protein VGF94_23610 [Kofleriaceae bacterium]|jgi:hypothetical protein
MRQPLANLALSVLLGGCSLIYNAGNIPAVSRDAPPDMYIPDANAAMLTLTDVSPAQILEGTGDGGSRPEILVIHGANIVAGAQVSVSGAASVTVDNTMVTVTSDSTYLALPLTSMVDGPLAAGTTVGLTIQVSQPIPGGGTTMQTIAGPMLQGLDELTATASYTQGTTYSKIMLPTFTITAASTATNATMPYELRATSTIMLGDITAHGGLAVNTAGGPGGPGACPGAGAQAMGSCPGSGGAGAAGLGTLAAAQGGDGGGGGFAAMGAAGTSGNAPGAGGAIVGDDMISTYTANEPAGGGGGGSNSGLLGSKPGDGAGGGGGVIEVSAGGDVTAGTIDVTGGTGTAAEGGGGGGGGAGGAILVRSGGTLSIGQLTATGGMGGGTGGVGSSGRIRWDNSAGTAPAASPAAARGPTFVGMSGGSTPLVLTATTLYLVGTPNATVTVFAPGSSTGVTATFDASGNASVNAALATGFNHVCAVVAKGDQGHPESQECIDVAYLP